MAYLSRSNSSPENGGPQLRDEYKTYKILNGTPNIPYAYYFGQEGLHNILVIDLLGPSLEDLFDWCGRKFSVKTVVQVAVQMITLIEDLHAHDLIYRDIKPDNFLIGRPGQPDANNIHLIDFGMAKQYRDPKTKQHIPYREKNHSAALPDICPLILTLEESSPEEMIWRPWVTFSFIS